MAKAKRSLLPMRGIICYYSGSGNTKLACQYLKNKVTNADFQLYNIVKTEIPDFAKYDVAGFATFTDFNGVPRYFYSFFDRFEHLSTKYAFVFNTFGFSPGKTLKLLAEMVEAKGFNVLSGHSLHTPESYPPMRTSGLAFEGSPNSSELKKFNEFISRLDKLLGIAKAGKVPASEKISIGLFNTILPEWPRTKAKEDLGEQKVDENLCVECGTCRKLCPYEAIQLAPKPVFDHVKCFGCWACYNHCTKKAIYTKRFKGVGQYPKPKDKLIKKLTA